MTEGSARPSGIPHGEVLLAFAEAALGEDRALMACARQRLFDEMGAESLLDAAGVVGTFQQMDRIADATGIPLDASMMFASQDVRDELGLQTFASAANTPAPGTLRRAAARLLVGLRPWLFRKLGAAARR